MYKEKDKAAADNRKYVTRDIFQTVDKAPSCEGAFLVS